MMRFTEVLAAILFVRDGLRNLNFITLDFILFEGRFIVRDKQYFSILEILDWVFGNYGQPLFREKRQKLFAFFANRSPSIVEIKAVIAEFLMMLA